MSQNTWASLARAGLLGAAVLSLAGCSGKTPGAYTKFEGMPPDGTVDMRQVQAAYIGSASGGNGTLFYRGRAHPFTIGGVGIGGIGASSIEARGDVYNLPNISLFPGTYAQGRYGFAVGSTSAGDLWLQNESGVVMHLRAKREGLMLSLGGDAIVISMNR